MIEFTTILHEDDHTHVLTADGKDVTSIEAQIDLAASELWGITAKELGEIKNYWKNYAFDE